MASTLDTRFETIGIDMQLALLWTSRRAILLAALLVGCNRARAQPLPDSMDDRESPAFRRSVDKLAPEDQKLVWQYIHLHGWEAGHARTLGEAIDRQREENERPPSAAASAAQPAAPNEKLVAMLNATLLEKEEDNARYRQIIVTVMLTNTGSEGITRVQGNFEFNDDDGKPFAQATIDFKEPLGVGRTARWKGRISNMYGREDEMELLSRKSLASLHVRWVPQSITLTNGTRVE